MLFKNPFQMKLLFAINSAFDLNSDSVVGWRSVNYLHEKFRLKCQIVCKLKVSRGKVGNPHKYLSLLIPTGVDRNINTLSALLEIHNWLPLSAGRSNGTFIDQPCSHRCLNST